MIGELRDHSLITPVGQDGHHSPALSGIAERSDEVADNVRMVTGLEVAVGFLIAWFARKAGKAWKRIDGMADEAMDAGLDKLHDVVMSKLGGDSALRQLEAEATSTGEAGTRTQARVRLALEEAAEQDPTFAADLEAALTKLHVSAGDHGVAIGRDVRSDSGVSIVMTGGSVTMERPDPSGPGGRSPRT
jgi:hypothetical protein